MLTLIIIGIGLGTVAYSPSGICPMPFFCLVGIPRGLDSQPGLLIHLYQKSLEGEALKWNSSLPLDALRSFDDVIDRFTSQ